MSAAGGNAAPGAGDGGAREVRNRQIVLFSAIAAAGLLAVAAWIASSGGKAPAPGARIAAELADPGTAEESWTRRSEGRIGSIENRLREIETENRRLGRENARLQDALQKQADDARRVIDRLAAAQNGLGAGRPAPVDAAPGANVFAPVSPGAGASPNPAGPAAAPQSAPPLIERFRLEGPGFEEAEDEDAKPLSLWLPAGSHAQATVIAGVDASAGVSSQGDPRPVLLRVTGPAWTAAEDGTAQSVDIEGCTVTGAAYGDLSSEKVYARLRTLTCAGPEPGTVVETGVAGFVAGAGKTGVRGPVVSREGALVEKAFLAGLVSGVGQGVSSAFAPQAVATGTGGAAVSGLCGTRVVLAAPDRDTAQWSADSLGRSEVEEVTEGFASRRRASARCAPPSQRRYWWWTKARSPPPSRPATCSASRVCCACPASCWSGTRSSSTRSTPASHSRSCSGPA